MTNLTKLKEWEVLARHHEDLAHQEMRDWFKHDSTRFSRFSLRAGEIFLDYSRSRVIDETIDLLCNLAYAVNLPLQINALFTGAPLNFTEKRPALHTALRDKNHTPIFINGENIAASIDAAKKQMQIFAEQIHNQSWKGATGKTISHIVNVGIGGSFTGPMAFTFALNEFKQTDLKFHFISTIDPAHIHDVLQQIDPERTLFIISSKSFSTLETLTNMQSLLALMTALFGKAAIKHHFIAITAAPEKALKAGIPKENIFPLWDWVGGRYSIWSAIGLPLLLMIGSEHFAHFLQGAYEMDQHFREAPFRQNMPVILALLGVWYRNFFAAPAQAIIPYAHRLRYLIPYLQQVDMESNGKSVDLNGCDLPYHTGPILFGEEGIIGQHAYHQLLHQGKHLIPVDFILAEESSHSFSSLAASTVKSHEQILMASALSQAQALMSGKTYQEAYSDLVSLDSNNIRADELAKHQRISGNKPSNILYLKRITPKNLGALIALYEHKIFVQGMIWHINSFDQWGVELGKKLLPPLLQQIEQHQKDPIGAEHSSKDQHLLSRLNSV